MDINNRVKALREVMKEKKLDAFIIPSSDNHLSEYVGDYFKCREWISGFTGSAGTAVVTLNEAHLWVDGRYYIQAEKQVQGSEYIVEKLGMPNVDNFPKWLCKSLSEGDKVGFNGKVMAVSTFDDLQKSLSEKGIEIKVEDDLINQLWKDRPSIPFGKLFILDTKYVGKTALEKINEVREKLSEENVNYTVISSLDDIAWLLNLRGRDIPCNPVFLSYVLLSNDKCTLYIDSRKIDNEIISYLNENSIDVKQYNDIEADLKKLTLEDKVLFDPNKTNVWLNEAISKDIKRKEHRDITTDLKSVKNSIELENLEKCQVKDGIAMVGFIHWLKSNIGKIEIDEISASDKLEVFRREMENNLGLSFDSISAYSANAAMMHYKATEENKSKLEPRGLYLIDSGGQYLEGTTDITRTIVLGDLTEEEREDFTLVLKGNIGLSRAIFLQGTTGSNLDILARKPIWEKGLDYKCGTGHGVGFLLNVHEGPQRISPQPNNVALKVGMIVTNEPGIYKEGKHGIRIENDLVVTKHTETEFGTFFKFDEMSYCPIDLDGIKVEMLTNEEKQWLNTYHKKVYDKLNPYLSDEDLKWLKEATREI